MFQSPLNDAQRGQIAELLVQGLSLYHIAERLQVSYDRVFRATHHLGMRPPRRPSRVQKPLPDLPSAQQEVLARYAASNLNVGEVAQHLRVDWRQLSRELRGRDVMRPERIQRLCLLFDKLANPAG